MKLHVMFKTPDALDYAIQDGVNSAFPGDAEDDTIREQRDELEQTLRNKAAKWISYGECVTIEIDTDTDAARVVR
jgi:hypothetical protein